MTSVAVNIIPTPAQPGAANSSSSTTAVSGLDALFGAILANEAAAAGQTTGVAANDIMPANFAALPVEAPADATPPAQEIPAVSPEIIAPAAKAVAKANGKNEAKPETDNKGQDQVPPPFESGMLAALLPQQARDAVPAKIEARLEGEINLDAMPSKNPTVPVAPDQPAGAPVSADEQAAAQTNDAAAKPELAKEFGAAESKQAPLTPSGTPDKQDSQAQNSAVGAKPAGEQASHDQQPRDQHPRERDDRATQAVTASRGEAPITPANSNTPANPAHASIKADVAQQNFGLSQVQPSAPATHSTAATLHSVSTLRDLPPAPDLRGMAVKIANFSSGDIKHFEIRMDPAELGRVDVHLTVDDAGATRASLIVEKPQTLELLQKDSTGLERALKDAGLELSNNGLNFSLKGQERHQDAGTRSNGRVRNMQAVAPNEAAAVSSNHFSSGKTGLDIRV